MNMPGFTAEASLNKKGDRYQQEATDVTHSATGVVPAWWHCIVIVDSSDGSGWISCHWHPE